MRLTPEQLQRLYDLARDYHLALAIEFVGRDAAGATEEDVQRLVDAGILSQEDADRMLGLGVFDDAIALALLRAHVEEAAARTKRGWFPDDVEALSWKRLKARLVRDPIPMTDDERNAASWARYRAGQYVKGAGDKVANDVVQAGLEMNSTAETETVGEVIQDATERAIEERRTAGKLRSDLGC